MDIDYTGNSYAFPSDLTIEPAKGLTKREYIAAMVMASMAGSEQWKQETWAEMAEHAVKAAAALLEELKP